jgi:hypothetical protein
MPLTATVTDAFDAGAKGAAIAQADTNAFFTAQLNARKTAAYNALAQTYGPIAGDPDSAIKLNALSQSQALFPSKLTQAQLDTQKSQQDLDYSKQANPLRIQALQQGVDKQNALAPYDAPNAQATLDQTKATTAQTNVETATKQKALDDTSDEDTRAQQGILAAVKQAIASGVDPGEAFDRYAPQIAAMEGVDPDHMAPLREKLVQDPQGTIKAFEDAFAAAHPNASLQRASAAQMSAEAAKTRADAAMLTAQNKVNGGNVIKPGMDPESQANAADTLRNRTVTTVAAIDDAIALIDSGKLPTNDVVRAAINAGKGHINLNSTSTKLNADLQQIQASGSLQDVAASRQSGGLAGKTTNVDLELAGKALVPFDPLMDYKDMRAILLAARPGFVKVAGDLADHSAKMRALASAKSAPGSSGKGTAPTLSDDQLLQKYGIK